MQTNQLCVPTSALEASDESDQPVAPGVGDEVEVSIKGKVDRVEGGNAYVTPTEANGQPITNHKPAGEPEAGNEDDQMDQMMSKAASDQQEGMGY